MTSGIYLITCRPAGRLPIYYVGQSVNVHRRMLQHRGALRKGRHFNARLQRSWDAHGGEAAFSFELLEPVPIDALDAAEVWWLHEMVGHSRVFNVARDPDAPCRGIPKSEETRRRIAAAHSGERHYNYGGSLSDEHRARISAGGRGIKRSAETRGRIAAANLGERNSMFGKNGAANPRSRAVIGTCIKTGTVRRYESGCMAEADGFDQSGISRCANGKSRAYRGYVWTFSPTNLA